jgi:hypothetical protein
LRKPRLALSIAALLLSTGAVSWAQGRHGGGMMGRRGQGHAGRTEHAPKGAAKTPIEEFERMPQGERQHALEQLPPKQREQVQQRLQQYDQLPLEQRQQIQAQLQRLHQLPADKQEQVRNSIRKFSDQPADRKQALRQELGELGPLSPADRKAHFNSPEFKKKFSKDEQDMLKHMSELLPSEER